MLPGLRSHAQAVSEYPTPGFDEVCVNQIGPELSGFFAFFRREIRPKPSL
jgi:hypothetical protein